MKQLTYKDSGVDIDAGNESVRLIKNFVRSTYRPEVLGDIGGFGGLFALKNYDDPILVSGTDFTALIDDKTGVVRKGALWYEETLPGETILSGMVWCEKVYVAKKNSEEKNVPTPKALLDAYCVNNDHLQIGGKASTGKGIVRLVYESAEEGKADAC